jgi:hypothetical protein
MKKRIGTILVSILRSVFFTSAGSTSMPRLLLYASYVSSSRDEVSDATVGEGCTTSMSFSDGPVEGIMTYSQSARKRIWATISKRWCRGLLNNIYARMRHRHVPRRLTEEASRRKVPKRTAMSFVQDSHHAASDLGTTACPRSAVPRSWSMAQRDSKGLLTTQADSIIGVDAVGGVSGC